MSEPLDAAARQPDRVGRLTLAGRVVNGLMDRYRLEGAALAAAAAAILIFHYSGTDRGMRDSFIFMGFDTERAVLLTAGVGSMLAGTVAGAITNRRLVWVGSGLVGLSALFGRTYLAETMRAANNPLIGHFDLTGWAQSTVALIGAGILLGLGAGILSSQARAGLSGLLLGASRAWTARDFRALPRRGLAIGTLLLTLTVVVVPVLGQMLNFGPDSLMLTGGPAGIPIIANGTGRGLPLASGRPAGSGTVLDQTLPAPWTGGTSSVV